MKYNGEIIETSDSKKWIYSERDGWIEVTMPEKWSQSGKKTRYVDIV